jgi:glycerol-3-phosphate acyltransferase PlsY
MNALRLVAAGLAGYALGSIPTARIAAKLSTTRTREGGADRANVLRVTGR